MNLFFHLLEKTYTFLIVFSSLLISTLSTSLYADNCPCSGRMTSVTFKYDENGTAGVDFYVYDDHIGTNLIQHFSNVQPGDLLTVESSMIGLSRFGNKIYLGTTVGTCLTYVQTSCYVDIIGDIFIGFEVVAYEDYAGNSCFQPAGLGNRVFEDTNANGIQDVGEIGMDGITVILYDKNGIPEEVDVTSNGGEYEFTNLIPGEYSVGFPNLPFGYVNTIANAGLNDQLDSDVEENASQTSMIHLEPSVMDDSWDLGILQGVSFPVELIHFDLSLFQDAVRLDWTTASEQNNERFEIERSVDMNNFEWIGSVEGAGTTQDLQEYQFEDPEALLLGVQDVFYRIKQIDFDGTYTYSSVMELELPQNGDMQFEVYPNPVSELLQVAAFSEGGTLLLLDLNGKVIHRQPLPSDPGHYVSQVDVSSMTAGTYLIRLADRNGVQTKKIVCK
ncbi:MAG: SdrD B-like domain-containing protein [Bacteroidota bacterium]